MRQRHVPSWLTLAVLLVGCGDDPPTEVKDTAPPARIDDLAASHESTGYVLTWTAPGDDDSTGTVATYELRRIRGDIAADWDDAIPVPPPTLIVPAGETQTAEIDSLEPGVWQFGVIAADEVPNWSELSNVASLTIATSPTDSIPPAAVTDLTAEVTRDGVILRWTAPGDDDHSGMASVYDLRYSLELITPESFANGTAVGALVPPKTSGQLEVVGLSDLEEGHEYFFALKSADDVANVSDLSNIATANLPHTRPRQLTFNSTIPGATSPAWSPDGSSIAYSNSLVGGFAFVTQVFVISLNGGSPEQYTFSTYQAGGPDWSPDGSRFALWERVDDPSRRRLAVMAATPGAEMTILASHEGLDVSTSRWSPDGTRIAYQAFSGNPIIGLMRTLYSIPSDGGTPTFLAGPFSRQAGLSWSPDGTMIAYDSDQGGNVDIWIMPSTGGTATQLTTGEGDKSGPSWSPDGATIAYVHSDAGQRQILGIAPTGGPSFLLVDDAEGPTGRLAWSPDGQRMAYVKGSPPNIWIAGVERP